MTPAPTEPDRVAARIRTYLSDEVILDSTAHLEDQTPLLSGLLDSLSLMDLVSFIEDEFGVELEQSDIEPKHFGTVRDIAALVVDRSAAS